MPEAQDPAVVETADTAIAPDDTVSLDGMWKFLDDLSGHGGKTEICDVDGTVFQVPTLLPARQQIGVLRELKGLMDEAVSEEERAAIAATVSGGVDITALMASMLEIIGSDGVLGRLDDAFNIAFPAVMEQSTNGSGDRPTDRFPIEEIVGALVPFFVRMVRKVLKKTMQ